MQTENTYVETDLGNIALNPRGEYLDEASYEYLDIVSYKGGSYMCLAELTKTVSGIAPVQSKNTEHWQMLTLPGGLTSDYITMHDDVVNKAKQVETSRAAAELSQQEVEAAQADVSQMRQDTQEAAEEAASSRDSAAGYAQSAEASRTAAKESEDNINAQVVGFDAHVAEKTSAAEISITEARRAAVSAVSTKQDNATQAVTDEGNKQIKNVEDAGTEQVGKAKSAGASAVSAADAAGVSAVNTVKTQQTASIKAVADEGTQQVTAVNTAGSTQASIIETKGADQVKAIQEAGENALQNISDGVDKGLSEEGKAADAKATGEAISNLTEDLSNKITKFYASNQGETHITDSDNGKIRDMMIYGKSSQDGTPTPENPVEIKSVVNPTVKVTNEDGLKVQLVTLNNITLNAISVSSGGNVTINGQQYVADYVDVERGKLIRMCKEKVFDGTEKWRSESSYMVADMPNFSYVDNNNHKHMTYLLCNKYKVSTTIGDNDNLIFVRINGDGVVIKDTLHQSTVDDWKKYLNDNPCIVHCLSAIPEEIDLTTEEIIAFKSLVTCYPTTNISVNSEQLDGYTVFNYPISMQNGWNYVKQQLNDNRDYIYDMDLQSAEAYVNSEYAVALTELEV